MSDTFTFTVNPAISQSAQGQLSSQYTAWLSDQLMADVTADYLAFLFLDLGLPSDASDQLPCPKQLRVPPIATPLRSRPRSFQA